MKSWWGNDAGMKPYRLRAFICVRCLMWTMLHGLEKKNTVKPRLTCCDNHCHSLHSSERVSQFQEKPTCKGETSLATCTRANQFVSSLVSSLSSTQRPRLREFKSFFYSFHVSMLSSLMKNDDFHNKCQIINKNTQTGKPNIIPLWKLLVYRTIRQRWNANERYLHRPLQMFKTNKPNVCTALTSRGIQLLSINVWIPADLTDGQSLRILILLISTTTYHHAFDNTAAVTPVNSLAPQVERLYINYLSLHSGQEQCVQTFHCLKQLTTINAWHY